MECNTSQRMGLKVRIIFPALGRPTGESSIANTRETGKCLCGRLDRARLPGAPQVRRGETALAEPS